RLTNSRPALNEPVAASVQRAGTSPVRTDQPGRFSDSTSAGVRVSIFHSHPRWAPLTRARAKYLPRPGFAQPSTAPSEAERTSLRYLPSTPLVKVGGSGSHPSLRRASSSSSTSRSRVLFATSRRIWSPSRTNAIGPPSTASGATCPTHRRSEERRGGKEGRSRGGTPHEREK